VQSLSHEFVIQVAAGSSHSLALADSGEVYSWGEGLNGQLGVNEKRNALDAEKIHTRALFVKVSAGVAHSAAVTEKGQLMVWGSNNGC